MEIRWEEWWFNGDSMVIQWEARGYIMEFEYHWEDMMLRRFLLGKNLGK
jgi:hypothetical protein